MVLVAQTLPWVLSAQAHQRHLVLLDLMQVPWFQVLHVPLQDQEVPEPPFHLIVAAKSFFLLASRVATSSVKVEEQFSEKKLQESANRGDS